MTQPSGRPTRETNSPSITRAYRLQKRRRPCDQCRERKQRCQAIDERPPCPRCAQAQVECTFRGKASQKLSTPRAGRQRLPSQSRDAGSSTGGDLEETSASIRPSSLYDTGLERDTGLEPIEQLRAHSSSLRGDALDDTPASNSHLTDLDPVHSQSSHQYLQTLDNLQDQVAVLLGPSSESDPWLLRHARFDEYGQRDFHGQQYFRNIGGVPTTSKIPVHFFVAPNSLYDSVALSTRTSEKSQLRMRLTGLIAPELGVRLIRLFFIHVYPLLPIISSTLFISSPDNDLPSEKDLGNIPCHVLAAIYGISIPFARNDEHLTIAEVSGSLPQDQLWRIVYESLQEELHRPHLSTLQAGLLYLHKETSQDRTEQLLAPVAAFKWSWLGTLVGLAHNLGLHMDTRMCAVPNEELRVRRHLWWALYIEDKMLSLLMGRPPYIHSDEWDVCAVDVTSHAYSQLVPFTGQPQSKVIAPFQDMAKLAIIAEDVQSSLYSLRSCQRLAEDLAASIEAANPILKQLSSWRESIPHLRSSPDTTTKDANDLRLHQIGDGYPKTVYVAYVTLVAYVWRALLRATLLSPAPPLVVDKDSYETNTQPYQELFDLSQQAFYLEGLSWDLPDLSDIEPLMLDESFTSGMNAMSQEVQHASVHWAASLASLTESFPLANYTKFWYSWSGLSFAVISNFILLNFVQAPSSDIAEKAKEALDTWRRVLRDQSMVSPLLLLALYRINGFFAVGLDKFFTLPNHVQSMT